MAYKTFDAIEGTYKRLPEKMIGTGFFLTHTESPLDLTVSTTRKPSRSQRIEGSPATFDIDYLQIMEDLRAIDVSLAESVFIDQELSENAAAQFMAETFERYFECILTTKGNIRGHDTPSAHQELYIVARRVILKRMKELGKLVEGSIKRNVRLPKHTADTSRLAYRDDMPLFNNLSYFRIGGGRVAKTELLSKLKEKSHEILFAEMGGTEWNVFQLLALLYDERKRPAEVSIERGEFLRRLGLTPTERTEKADGEKIKAILHSWDEKRWKIGERSKDKNRVFFKSEIKLPVMREREGGAQGRGSKTVWVFDSFDPIIFAYEPDDFRKLSWRPVEYLMEQLGLSNSTDCVSHALRELLTEAEYRAGASFAIDMDKAHMTLGHFKNNSDRREQAWATLCAAVKLTGADLDRDRKCIFYLGKKDRKALPAS